MSSITNKELSERFDTNLAKIRRWSREFLPPDQRATMRSGYARKLPSSEAYEVILGGHLVSVLGFSVHEAKTIIRDLKPWLESKGLFPGKKYAEKRSKNPYFLILIRPSQQGKGFHYEIRGMIKTDRLGNDQNVIQETYSVEIIGPKDSYPDPYSIRRLDITMLLLFFIEVLEGGDMASAKKMAMGRVDFKKLMEEFEEKGL